MHRIEEHPILGDEDKAKKKVTIQVDGQPMKAYEGEMIASALIANGIHTFRYTKKLKQPRGLYCGIGRCTDCVMIVNGIPNVRTCITPVEDGMTVRTQKGLGHWERSDNSE
ncbi:MAG: (2Fe-2S)-binding protein [Clostridia bacterium]|nr:(2Fe-2S)-binding protein [Clostridia bacterium]